jgi:hypothetical protein
MKTPASLLALSLTIPLSAALLDSPQSGGLKLKSISSISFGKDGMLLVADPISQSVIAIETKETGAKTKPGAVADIAATIAGGGMPVVVTLDRVPVSCCHAARRGGLTRGARRVKA